MNHCNCAESAECDSIDGSCQCYHGFTGARCDLECPTGKWGMNCSQTCNKCKNKGECDPIDGECHCAPGFMGEKCELTCGMDQWGADCLNECRCASDRKLCNPVNGICHCAAGLMGDLCNQYCPEGSWGPDCVFRCSCEMENSRCQATTGDCVCHPGFTGPKCDQICPEGFWGEQCAHVCDCGEDICNPVIGCCKKNDLSCDPTKLKHLPKERTTVVIMSSIVSGLYVIMIILLILVFYYRRKYVKERGPTIPTITYHPTVTNSEPISTKNGFNNPLYRKSAGIATNDQLAGKNNKFEHLANKEQSDRLQNDYAKFDDFYAEIDPSFDNGKNLENSIKGVYDYGIIKEQLNYKVTTTKSSLE
ncbi:unnamed protein product [Brugia timori]|uniref:EGF-like domain-containing protein n=1 Tax=Brugia timori TaxID=42155 RepID=A0A0R3QJD2_9BILA|nr:unnamed protein product [Brugia timori]